MYRKAEKILQAWKANSKKKALLITGQRQAGKTYIVREFGKANYKHYVEINFITTPSAIVDNRSLFYLSGNKSAQDAISLYCIQFIPHRKERFKAHGIPS